MLYELLIRGEYDRWETFKKAEREAQRRDALRTGAGSGRLRRLRGRRAPTPTGTARQAGHSA